MRRQKLEEENMTSNAYIERLKKDLEKINEQLRIQEELAKQYMIPLPTMQTFDP